MRINARRTGGNLELLRQFHAAEREKLIERLVAKRNAPGEDQTASLCVGAPSNFQLIPLPSTPTITWPNDDRPDEPEGEAITYTAIWWELEDVRVENPEDSEQYVNTKRIKQVRYRRPDGSEVQLDNRPVFAAFPAS